MAITLTTMGLFEAGTTAVGNGTITVVDTSGGAEAVVLPTGDIPIGYQFRLSQNGASAVTSSAGTGETLVGDTATAADNDVIFFFRSGATEWTGSLTPAT